MENLSQSEQEALNEFVIITGVSLDDPDTATKAHALLTRHNFNLNNAILAFFDHGLELPSPAPSSNASSSDLPESAAFSPFDAASTSTSRAPTYRNFQDDFVAELLVPRLPKAPRISNKWQMELGIHVSQRSQAAAEEPPREPEQKPRLPILWIILLIVPKAVSLLYSALRYLLGLSLRPPTYNILLTQFDYDRYSEEYSLELRVQPDTVLLYDASFTDYNGAHAHCQTNYDFLLLVLVDDKSESFVGEMMENEQFKELLNKRTGSYKETRVFFGNISRCPEAFEVCKTYRVRKVPYFALIGNVSRDPAVMASMSVIYKADCSLEDGQSLAAIIGKLAKILSRHLSDYNPQLITKRLDKQEIELSRLIKEKQDEAYLESLESDKVKKIEKEKEQKKKELQETLAVMRSGFVSHLISSEYFQNLLAVVDQKDVVRVAIKLPDGKRIVQKFPKSLRMAEVYLFVETQIQSGELTSGGSELSVEDFVEKFDFSFDLFKPHPRTLLSSTLATIEESGELRSGDNILFEYRDELE